MAWSEGGGAVTHPHQFDLLGGGSTQRGEQGDSSIETFAADKLGYPMLSWWRKRQGAAAQQIFAELVERGLVSYCQAE